MTEIYRPVMRVLVVLALGLATATLMLVAVSTVRAAGALAIGTCGAFGEAYDFCTIDEAQKRALSKCADDGCRVVTTAKRGCAAFAVDFSNPCGVMGGARASGAARMQPCGYRDGGKECVIFCDAKG